MMSSPSGPSPLHKAVSKDNLADPMSPSSDPDAANEDEIEASVKLSLMIEDQDGKQLWSELFGLNVSQY